MNVGLRVLDYLEILRMKRALPSVQTHGTNRSSFAESSRSELTPQHCIAMKVITVIDRPWSLVRLGPY